MRMLQEIHRNYTQRVTLGTLAAVLGRQRAYLGRLFRDEVGITVHQYVTRARIIFGATEVRSGVKVEAVALCSGYRSKKNFYRQFRRRFGTTPHGYRSHEERANGQVTAGQVERIEVPSVASEAVHAHTGAGVAMLITDAGGTYIGANSSAVSLTGYPVNELRGLSVAALFPHLSGQEGSHQMQIVFAAPARTNAVLHTKTSGPIRVRLITATNMLSGFDGSLRRTA